LFCDNLRKEANFAMQRVCLLLACGTQLAIGDCSYFCHNSLKTCTSCLATRTSTKNQCKLYSTQYCQYTTSSSLMAEVPADDANVSRRLGLADCTYKCHNTMAGCNSCKKSGEGCKSYSNQHCEVVSAFELEVGSSSSINSEVAPAPMEQAEYKEQAALQTQLVAKDCSYGCHNNLYACASCMAHRTGTGTGTFRTSNMCKLYSTQYCQYTNSSSLMAEGPADDANVSRRLAADCSYKCHNTMAFCNSCKKSGEGCKSYSNQYCEGVSAFEASKLLAKHERQPKWQTPLLAMLAIVATMAAFVTVSKRWRPDHGEDFQPLLEEA